MIFAKLSYVIESSGRFYLLSTNCFYLYYNEVLFIGEKMYNICNKDNL